MKPILKKIFNLLPDTTRKDAETLAERVRMGLDSTCIIIESGCPI